MQLRKIMAFAALMLLMACQPSGRAAQKLRAADENTAPRLAAPVRDAIACPAQSFEEFLQAFAADDKVRDRFTASEVLVTDWRNPNETQKGTEIKAVAKSDYRNFTLRYQDGAFHDVAPDGTVDTDPQDVQVVKEGDNYLVSYVYGLSEGNSWRFKAKHGCWQLAEDPEVSDP